MRLRAIKAASMGMVIVLGWMLVTTAGAQEDAPTSQPGEERMHDQPERPQKRDHGEMRGRPVEGDRRQMDRSKRGMRPGMGRRMGEGRDQKRGDNKYRGGERMGKRMSEEDIAKMMQVLRDYDPQLAERIEQVRGRNPREAMQMMRHAAPMVRRWTHMKDNDPEGYELQMQDMKLGVQARKLGEKIRKSGGNDKEAMTDLHKLVAQQFDVRQRQREHHLAKLEKKLEKLRQSNKKRAAARDSLIDKETARLTGQDASEEF